MCGLDRQIDVAVGRGLPALAGRYTFHIVAFAQWCRTVPASRNKFLVHGHCYFLAVAVQTAQEIRHRNRRLYDREVSVNSYFHDILSSAC